MNTRGGSLTQQLRGLAAKAAKEVVALCTAMELPDRHKSNAAKPVAATRPMGSDTVTRGVRIVVTPSFVPEESGEAPNDQWKGKRYVFAYKIRITNESRERVQLISRHWKIVDADGELHEVRGEGVVGQQPSLAPGQHFEYSSYCPLATAWGTMEGTFAMEGDGGEKFEVVVGRFYLVSE